MSLKNLPLIWRWTLRDMRERWMQVLGISLIIALGVALSSGLGSSVPWRIKSFEQSYDMLNMYDLKIELTQGSYLEPERLAQAINAIPHADWLENLELRLNLETSVDASTDEQYLLVHGKLVGVNVAGADGGPDIAQLHVTQGHGLQPEDSGQPVCIVEHNFASAHGLQPGDRSLQVSGGYQLKAIGTGISPEHFMVIDEQGGILGALAQDRYAIIFVPLATAQEIADLPNMVNQALITVPDELDQADLDQLEAELEQAIAQNLPEVSASVETKSEDLTYRVLWDDIHSDQEVFDAISGLLLLGAGFGAFILIGRIVDAQRREIGINMALGVPRWRIARRYLWIGAQIALLGAILGAGLGLILNQPLANEMNKLMPLPYTDASFQPDIFIESALVGILIPFLAVIYPIWRAVRVEPIQAIQTSYLVSSADGVTATLGRVPLPGSSLTLFPVRNLLRGLRRTLMTVLGLSIAIIILIAIIGMIDTFRQTLAVGRQELEREMPHRSLVSLNDFYPVDGPLVSQVSSTEGVDQAVPSVILPGQLASEAQFDAIVQLIDMDNELWTPSLLRGGLQASGPSVVINQKAARDLGVEVGDTVTLRHPYRESRHAWRMTQTEVQVAGIHRGILRTDVYMDLDGAAIMNLAGLVNGVQVNPAADAQLDQVRRRLTQTQGVASVRQVSASLKGVDDLLNQYVGVFVVLQVIVLIMAFLVAFNTTRSSMEEHRRDIATMFAFGARVRTVVRMAITENFITGLLATLLGIGLGWLVLSQPLMQMFESDAPELSPVVSVSLSTYGWAVLIGIVVVSLTPIVLTRRLLHMDIPSTLRVIE